METHDERYMRLALDQAKIALSYEWIPVGALFVKDNVIVAHGRKTGLVHPLFDHAEHNGCYGALHAGREGPRNLAGVTVYATLEPCLVCMSMLMTTRVSRIVYGLDDPYGGGTFLLSSPGLPPRFQKERPVVEGGVLREESRLLLREFFVRERDTNSKNWSDHTNPLVKLAMGDNT
jgi:tRNA(adenine34) deaminase